MEKLSQKTFEINSQTKIKNQEINMEEEIVGNHNKKQSFSEKKSQEKMPKSKLEEKQKIEPHIVFFIRPPDIYYKHLMKGTSLE